jgi:hypothetical protein
MDPAEKVRTPRDYFEAIRGLGHEPGLADAVGTWEIDVEGEGSWAVRVDHGKLSVEALNGARRSDATVRVRMAAPDFVRLARGEAHENVITAVLRGAIHVEGDIRFAQKIQNILPLPTHGGSES